MDKVKKRYIHPSKLLAQELSQRIANTYREFMKLLYSEVYDSDISKEGI